MLPLVALLNFFVFFAPELGRFVKREQVRGKLGRFTLELPEENA